MKRVSIADVMRKSSDRPPGYVEAFERLCESKGESAYTLSEDAYNEIVREFAPAGSRLRSPGKTLARVIYAVTGEIPGPDCPCKRRARQMDKWGWRGCWKNRETIIDWMVDEAKKRGHEVDRAKVWGLIRAAAKELRA